MKLKKKWSVACCVAAGFTLALLAACSDRELEPQRDPDVAKEDAAMRNEVPLVRPIILGRAGEAINVEFDLPPPGSNAAPALILGFRTESVDSTDGAALKNKILQSGLTAKVRLLRVDEGSVAMIPLSRVTPDQNEWVEVSADGSVPGVTLATVDSTLLKEAGLMESAAYRREYALASARDIEPGHYRATVELTSDHPELRRERAELLIAYSKRGK